MFTDDDDKAARLRALRNHGKGPGRPDTEYLGVNSRLDSIQAAILLREASPVPRRRSRRGRSGPTATMPASPPWPRCRELMAGATSVWAQYTIVTEDRDALAKACREAGVPTAIHYASALNCLPPYRETPTSPAGLPQAEWLAERVISLPMHPYLTAEAQDLIVATVRQALTSSKAGVAHAAE